MFLLLLASLMTFQLTASEYSRIEKSLSAITTNYTPVLENLENEINTYAHSLSNEECATVVKQLELLKKELCARPGAGLMILPLFATAFLGVKSWFHYHEARSVAQGGLLRGMLDSGKAVDTFMSNFFLFALSLLATVAVEIEYRETVNSLFRKERTIERRINQMIVLLKK